MMEQGLDAGAWRPVCSAGQGSRFRVSLGRGSEQEAEPPCSAVGKHVFICDEAGGVVRQGSLCRVQWTATWPTLLLLCLKFRFS